VSLGWYVEVLGSSVLCAYLNFSFSLSNEAKNPDYGVPILL
jgi:hypothetical protein